MEYLKGLQYLINFFYYGFFSAVIVIISLHIFIPGESIDTLLSSLSITGYEENPLQKQDFNYLILSLNISRFLLFAVVLIFFKKVVRNFAVGNVFDDTTTKSLKFMGITTVILGCLKMFMKVYIPYSLGRGLTLFSLNFTGFGSTYFIIALGLLFIYMSKVLEESARLQEENKLTI